MTGETYTAGAVAAALAQLEVLLLEVVSRGPHHDVREVRCRGCHGYVEVGTALPHTATCPLTIVVKTLTERQGGS